MFKVIVYSVLCTLTFIGALGFVFNLVNSFERLPGLRATVKFYGWALMLLFFLVFLIGNIEADWARFTMEKYGKRMFMIESKLEQYKIDINNLFISDRKDRKIEFEKFMAEHITKSSFIQDRFPKKQQSRSPFQNKFWN